MSDTRSRNSSVVGGLYLSRNTGALYVVVACESADDSAATPRSRRSETKTTMLTHTLAQDRSKICNTTAFDLYDKNAL